MCAVVPEVPASMAIPLMKWSTPLATGSIGIRFATVHVVPFPDLLITISLVEQFVRKPQSGHTTYTLPLASIAAEGNPALRMSPASPWLMNCPTFTAAVQLCPPLVELKACTNPLKPRIGTITFPFGFTNGIPPIPKSLPCVATGVLQVIPPSVEVLIWIRSPEFVLSHSE